MTISIRALTAAVATAGITGTLMFIGGGSALAAGGGGCPEGGDWFLAPTGIFIDQLDNGNVQDQNGDGLACFKVNKGQTDKHNGIPSFTWKDNTNPV